MPHIRILFFIIVCTSCRASDFPAELHCFSCSSLDKDAYKSRYGGSIQLEPSVACGRSFIDISNQSSASNRIMFEKLINCNEALNRKSINRRASYCVKIVGYETTANSEIIARTCSDHRLIPGRKVYHSKSIRIGNWTVRGTMHFCEEMGCNRAGIVLNSSTVIYLLIVCIISVKM